jgi:hypothetical protein
VAWRALAKGQKHVGCLVPGGANEVVMRGH